MFIIVIILSLIGGTYCCMNYKEVCTQTKEVEVLGGCDRYTCGVKYTDGSYGEQHDPVVGQKFCTARTTVKRK